MQTSSSPESRCTAGTPAGTWAGAVALRAGRIVAVGSEAEVRDRVGSAVTVLHLPGRMVVAGFQGAHVHPPTAGRNRLAVSRYHPTSVKIMIDGVIENFSGALLAPYCDGHGGHTVNTGLSYLDRAELRRSRHRSGRARLPGAYARYRGPGRPRRP